VQRITCQLNTLLVVLLHFAKGRMIWFSCLLPGFDGCGVYLVSIGLGLDCVPVLAGGTGLGSNHENVY
jgi:hypothetical protein